MRVPRPRLLRIGYLVAAIISLPWLAWNGFVEQTNRSFTGILNRLAPGYSESSAKLVLVAIDDQTLQQTGPLPLSRSIIAQAVGLLAAAKPAAIGIDLLLADATDANEEAALRAVLAGTPNVIVGAALDADASRPPRWLLPRPTVLGAARVAHVHANLDADGVARSVLLAKEAENQRYWALGLELAALANGAGRPVEKEREIVLGSIRIPASRAGEREMLIRYAGPEGTFSRLSFGDVLNGAPLGDRVRGKIVIIGVTAQGAGDRLPTPVTSSMGMSGAEIHANVVRTILDRSFLRPAGAVGDLALSGAVASWAILVIRKLRRAALGAALAGGVTSLPLAALGAFHLGYVIPLASMLVCFLFAAALAGAGEYTALALQLDRSQRRHTEHAYRMQAIAHEIRTPLTAIQGTSEMIAGGWLPDTKRAEMAGLLNRESQRLSSIVQTFLDLENVAAGTVALRREATNLRAFLDEALDRGRLYAARKAISIESRAVDVPIVADKELLSYAVYNLLTNAVKYSPKQTIVRLDAEVLNGDVAISVTDQGCGVAPEERTRIFQRFYRAQRDKAGPEQGAGIGLALVKEIAELHGGRVDVESRPGVGSRFTLHIPHIAP